VNTRTNKCCYHWSKVWHLNKRVKFQNQVAVVVKLWSLSFESASVGKIFFNGCSWSVCDLAHLLSSTFFARDRDFYVLKNLQKKIKCLAKLIYVYISFKPSSHLAFYGPFYVLYQHKHVFGWDGGIYFFSISIGLPSLIKSGNRSYINSVYIWFSMNCKVLLISTQRKTFSLSRVTL